MRTKAPCPTCGVPFSFWRVAFAATPFSVYCWGCGWRIVIKNDKAIMWAELGVLAVVTIILISLIVPRNVPRIIVLAVLWVVFFEMIELIGALMIINKGRFSKPE